MSSASPQQDPLLQRLRDVAVALQKTTTERDALASRASEPIAIVGIGCRFPGGATGPEGYWSLLDGGRDAIGPLEPRWQLVGARPAPDAPAWGGLVADVDRFDASFFGIAPREAATLDPQQRMLLEVTWEAFEDAGIAPPSLAGSDAGVFVGASWTDYGQSVLRAPDEARDAYAGTGNMLSVAAGRIAYTLGLHGPCVTVDTACSSSLVSVHLACQALRLAECSLAVAGGVSLMLSADTMTTMARLQALSPDGRCRSFDAAANGFVRGEGCGVVILKRLSDALRDGDPIWATVRGSAVNHDGRSNGLTAPNGPAQEALVRAALRAAKVAPEAVGYVETHGTGTPLGDPIELEALRSVVGGPRADGSKCVLGAVKTNIGHLESAAGIAGFIKTALVLRHGRIPANLNFRTLNPRIRQNGSSLVVASAAVEWARGAAARVAGVSSFGIGGTNAHAVLEEAPPAAAKSAPAPVRSAELVVLSARTPEAIRGAAAKLRDWLGAHPDATLGDVAFSALTTRASLPHRLALAVADRPSLGEALEAAASGDAATPAARAADVRPKVAFVFPGQGSQWIGMGRQLLDEEPAFRAAIDECDRAIASETGWSLIDELQAPAERSRLDRIDVVQPVLFAFEIALARCWQAWGVEPDAVVGHSMGEVAAACVAGALTVAEGASVICRRGALLTRIAGKGEMALVDLSMDEAAAAIEGFEDRVAVAVSNGPGSTVLSGEPGALGQVLAALEGRGVLCRRVKVDFASHSPQVDPLLGDLAARLAGVRPAVPGIRMHSTVTSSWVRGPELDARYWCDNLRKPVRFASSVQTLVDEGFTVFIEVTPHPILTQALQAIAASSQVAVLATGSLRREQPERLTLLSALGAVHAHGLPLDADRLFPAGGRRTTLPSYAWQRERHWVAAAAAPGASGRATEHPLLGVRLALAGTDVVHESLVSVQRQPWLEDHCAAGRPIVPAAAIAELIRAAAGPGRSVADLLLRVPIVLGEGETRRVQVVLRGEESRASVYSRDDRSPAEAAWVLHATAQLEPATPGATSLDLHAARARCRDVRDVEGIYAQLTAVGISYGRSFRTLRSLARGPGCAFAEVSLDEADDGAAYGLHPALLDGALQAATGAVDGPGDQPVMPFSVGRLVVHRAGASRAAVQVTVRSADAAGLRVDLAFADDAGTLVAEVSDLRLRRVDLGLLGRQGAPAADALLRLEWVKSAPPAPARSRAGRVAVVPVGDDALASAVVRDLVSSGVTCERVDRAALGDVASIDHVVCLWPEAGHGEAATDLTSTALEVVKAVASRSRPARLWWVTRRAVAVQEGDPVAPAAASVWGFGRTVTHEHPELSCTLVDVEGTGAVGAAILRELATADDEPEIAWRGGQRRVARLTRAPAWSGADAARTAAPWRTDGTTMVTGGLGALGLETARHLARRGVRHLLLVGRRGTKTPGAAQAVKELEALGARVTVAAADLADRASVARVLEAIPAAAPLRAIVHTAGAAPNGRVVDHTPETVAKAMLPKAVAAWHLHELTRGAGLDAFVLFSSVTGTIGNGGQGAYTAANAYLDGLAAHRRALGLPATSLAWGPWEGAGMAAELDARQRARVVAQGYRLIPVDEGRDLLGAALARPEGALVVARFDLGVVARAKAVLPAVWRVLIEPSASRSVPPKADWARDLAALPAAERSDAATQAVRAEVARVLSLGRASAVPPDRPLRELGLDSLMAVELRNALARRAGVTLPATVAFDHPTPAALGRFLLEALPEAPGVGESTSLALPEARPSIAPSAPVESGAFPTSLAVPEPRAHRIDSIPMGERWLVDAFRVIPSPGGFAQRTIDISGVMRALDVANVAGVRATLPHAMIRAAALALARNPGLHQTVCGYRRITPGTVDIGLSMAGQTTYAPVVVLPSVETQPLGVLVGAVEEAIVDARKREARDLVAMRRFGWMTPFGSLRRFVVRTVQEMFWYRRKIAGTFQVTCVPTVDSAVPLQFYSGSILAFGRPRDMVVPIDGRPAIRPMLTLTVCADHVAMDGLRAAALLNEIVAVLEGDELSAEAHNAVPGGGLQVQDDGGRSSIRALGPGPAANAREARSA